MVSLYAGRIAKREWTDTNSFDFLAGITAYVLRVDELHPNSVSDTYIWLIWIRPEMHKEFVKKLKANFKSLANDKNYDSWDHSVEFEEEGLVIIRGSFS